MNEQYCPQMSNKHRARCVTSLLLREMQIQIAVRCHFIAGELHSKGPTIMSARRDVEKLELSSIAGLSVQKVQSLCKNSLAAPQRIQYTITIECSNSTQGIYPGILKHYIHTKACTQRFIEALFLLAKYGSNSKVHALLNGRTVACSYNRMFNTTKKFLLSRERQQKSFKMYFVK